MPRKPKDQVQQVRDYQQVFGSDAGKRVLFDMMKAGHMLHSTFVPEDPHSTALREGERNMVLRVLAILNVDPAKLEELIKQGESNDAA